MSLGSKGNCRGLLLGEENRGMQVMFHMMNAIKASDASTIEIPEAAFGG